MCADEPEPIYLFFLKARDIVITHGYSEELEYFQNITTFEKCTESRFFQEYIWCILNLGMREQTMRPIYERFMKTLDVNNITTRFKNKQRAAATTAKENFVRWFGELKCAPDPVAYLQTLPLIGKTTKWHLARNIGIDCVKPDLHLIRLSKAYGYPSPLDLVKAIQKYEPEERLGTIDYVLWRYCNLTGDYHVR